jgi:hypothetical protein
MALGGLSVEDIRQALDAFQHGGDQFQVVEPVRATAEHGEEAVELGGSEDAHGISRKD